MWLDFRVMEVSEILERLGVRPDTIITTWDDYAVMNDFLKMLEAAIEGVKARGHADVGAATMLDAMVPSLDAAKTAAGEGKSSGEALDACVDASWKGAESTKPMVATKGRASYVGERGIGHQDPGATSYSYIMEAVRDTFKGKD